MKAFILFSLFFIVAHESYSMAAVHQFQICAQNRKNFETQAATLPIADRQNKTALAALYKTIDPKAADKFVEKEVDNYLSPCGCCHPGPNKPCVIL